MNEKYLPDYKMMNVVKEFLNKKKPIWIGNNIVDSCVNRLGINIDQINEANRIIKLSSKSITKPKKIMRKKLNSTSFTLKEAMRLYHKFNGTNAEMLVLVYPISKPINMTEDTFYVTACHISVKALAMGALLYPYGITQLMIDTFKTDLETFNDFNPQMEAFLEQKKAFVKIIPEKN